MWNARDVRWNRGRYEGELWNACGVSVLVRHAKRGGETSGLIEEYQPVRFDKLTIVSAMVMVD